MVSSSSSSKPVERRADGKAVAIEVTTIDICHEQGPGTSFVPGSLFDRLPVGLRGARLSSCSAPLRVHE